MKTSNGYSRIQTICLIILTAIAAAAAVYWLRPVLIPFVLALFIAIALSPIVDLLRRRARLPRIAAVTLTLILGFVVLGAVGVLVSVSVGDIAANADMYRDRVESLINWLVNAAPLDKLGVDREQLLQPFSQISGEAVGKLLLSTSRTLGDIISKGAMVFIFLCFLMFGGTGRALPADTRWGEIEASVKRYIVAKTLLSAATGILVGSALWILGIPLAVVFGLLAFLLNFIPSIGSILAVLLPVPVVLLSPDISPVTAVLAIALPGAVELTIGNVVEPRIMGKRLDLHPVVVIMALIFWGMLWGIIGMFLATPMTAVARILLQKHELTRPAAELLSGRITREKGAEPNA